MWIGGFCLHGGTIKTNSCVLKCVSPSISNNIGPFNNTQLWGLKPSEEKLVKVEEISYNEG
jgi:hypothetical protein